MRREPFIILSREKGSQESESELLTAHWLAYRDRTDLTAAVRGLPAAQELAAALLHRGASLHDPRPIVRTQVESPVAKLAPL